MITVFRLTALWLSVTVTKGHERAQKPMWWPGFSSEIADMVKPCKSLQDKQSKPLQLPMFSTQAICACCVRYFSLVRQRTYLSY